MMHVQWSTQDKRNRGYLRSRSEVPRCQALISAIRRFSAFVRDPVVFQEGENIQNDARAMVNPRQTEPRLSALQIRSATLPSPDFSDSKVFSICERSSGLPRG